MQRVDALICPRWTIRVEPEVVVEEGLAVVVDAGRIVAVEPVAEADARYAPAIRHELPAHVLLPGLVNAHCHAAMSLLRGYADDLAFDDWLRGRIWPAEARLVDPEFVAAGTRLAIAEMLRGGITCFSDMYYFPDIVGEVALDAGMRVVLGMIALDAPTVWAALADEYIEKGLAVHDRFRAEPLVTTAFAPHAPYTASDPLLERVRRLADELDCPIHMHVHESANEVEDALRRTGRRPLARLDALGLLSPAFIGVHATQLTDEEIELLARTGASIVHCPRSNMKLASGACRVAALRAAGVTVALGTDGAASNNRLDLLAEMGMAALLGKHSTGDAAALPAREIVAMATLGGARALNLANEIGSLVPGKAADIIAVDLGALELQPVLDPLAHLVYSAARHDVTDVWIAGEHLVSGGELMRLDREEIKASAAHWERRLRDE